MPMQNVWEAVSQRSVAAGAEDQTVRRCWATEALRQQQGTLDCQSRKTFKITAPPGTHNAGERESAQVCHVQNSTCTDRGAVLRSDGWYVFQRVETAVTGVTSTASVR